MAGDSAVLPNTEYTMRLLLLQPGSDLRKNALSVLQVLSSIALRYRRSNEEAQLLIEHNRGRCVVTHVK